MWTHALPIPLMGQLLRCLGFAALVLVWATVLGSPPVHAQTFNSGSTGADGALNLTTPGTVIFNPDTFTPPLDPEGDNIYHFTTINIAAGVTVRLLATHVNGPVFWLASGAVQIDGTLDLNGGVGHNPPATPAARLPSVPGAGGYPGGIGASPNGPAQPGSGPLGGVIGPGNSSGGGGGNPSNSFLVPLLGGSGGGGTQTGVGGGAGGGALLIASSQSIAITGTMQAIGGTGGVICAGGAAGFCANGGGGAGGSLRFVSPLISGTGTLRVTGGSGGGSGIIRLEAFQHAFTGTTTPGRILGSPFALFLPSIPPSTLRVVSVAGVSVVSDPTGSFTMPDVTINSATPVPVLIEARNIPLETQVRLHLFSENGTDQIRDSTPLAGTLELSTATASVAFPAGFSRGFVRATWVPSP